MRTLDKLKKLLVGKSLASLGFTYEDKMLKFKGEVVTYCNSSMQHRGWNDDGLRLYEKVDSVCGKDIQGDYLVSPCVFMSEESALYVIEKLEESNKMSTLDKLKELMFGKTLEELGFEDTEGYVTLKGERLSYTSSYRKGVEVYNEVYDTSDLKTTFEEIEVDEDNDYLVDTGGYEHHFRFALNEKSAQYVINTLTSKQEESKEKKKAKINFLEAHKRGLLKGKMFPELGFSVGKCKTTDSWLAMLDGKPANSRIQLCQVDVSGKGLFEFENLSINESHETSKCIRLSNGKHRIYVAKNKLVTVLSDQVEDVQEPKVQAPKVQEPDQSNLFTYLGATTDGVYDTYLNYTTGEFRKYVKGGN